MSRGTTFPSNQISITSSNLGSDKEAAAIRDFFSGICHWYDFYNHLFSLGIDILWRRALVKAVICQSDQKNACSSMRVLDLATGSGDVALLLQNRGIDVVGLDFCEPILNQAKRKGVCNLVLGDALNLPFQENTFDAATIAFGFRNFTDWERGAAEAWRVLRPGGWLHILEFTQPKASVRPFYFWYLKHILPQITGLLMRQKEAYMHLYTSVAAFPSAEALKAKLQKWKFESIHYQTFTFDIVALHSAQKPIHQ